MDRVVPQEGQVCPTLGGDGVYRWLSGYTRILFLQKPSGLGVRERVRSQPVCTPSSFAIAQYKTVPPGVPDSVNSTNCCYSASLPLKAGQDLGGFGRPFSFPYFSLCMTIFPPDPTVFPTMFFFSGRHVFFSVFLQYNLSISSRFILKISLYFFFYNYFIFNTFFYFILSSHFSTQLTIAIQEKFRN